MGRISNEISSIREVGDYPSGRVLIAPCQMDLGQAADVYFGRAQAILSNRERIKQKTIEHRRLQYRK